MSTLVPMNQPKTRDFSLFEEITKIISKHGITVPKTDSALTAISESSYSEMTLIPALSLQFLMALDSAKPPITLIDSGLIPFYFENNLMALTYKGFEVFIKHKRAHRSIARRAVKAWEHIFDDAIKVDWNHRQELFSNEGGSIYNIYPEAKKSLEEKEALIEANMKEHEGSELFALAVLSRDILKSDSLIMDYILGVFSLIEFVGCSILPYWEAAHTKEWNCFLDKCSKKNPNIERWIDLFDESKTAYRVQTITENGIPKEIRSPIPINIVDLFFNTLGNYERNERDEYGICDTYFNLKKRYRNTLTHGTLSSTFNFGIVSSSPDVMFNGSVETLLSNYDESYSYDALLNVDFHAYLQVNRFFRRFIHYIGSNYPAYYLLLKEAQVLPLGADLIIFKSLSEKKPAETWLELVTLQKQILIPYKYWDALHAKDIDYDEDLKKIFALVKDKEEFKMVAQEFMDRKREELLGMREILSFDSIPENLKQQVLKTIKESKENVEIHEFYTPAIILFSVHRKDDPDVEIASGIMHQDEDIFELYRNNEDCYIDYSLAESFEGLEYGLALSELKSSWYKSRDQFSFVGDGKGLMHAKEFVLFMLEEDLGIKDFTFTEDYKSEIDKLFEEKENHIIRPFMKVHKLSDAETKDYIKSGRI